MDGQVEPHFNAQLAAEIDAACAEPQAPSLHLPFPLGTKWGKSTEIKPPFEGRLGLKQPIQGSKSRDAVQMAGSFGHNHVLVEWCCLPREGLMS